MKNKTILILGGTGALGNTLTERYYKDNDVIIFSRDEHKQVNMKQKFPNIIVVSPDVGGVVRARALAKQINSDLAIVDKRRTDQNVSEVIQIIGNVEGMTCLIVDDIVDTAGTLCHAATALKEKGAKKVVAYITHPVLSGKANENITKSEPRYIFI